MIIGVTGGVAMGKSKVALKLNELFPNSHLFDADVVVSQLLTRENVCENVKKVFGDESIDASGLINRAFIREQVFDSAEQRAKLESILHPEVKNEFDTVVEKTSGFDGVILFADIPLLYESSCEFKCDTVLVVATDKNTQFKRLIKRSGVDHRMAINIINSQLDIEKKIELCDFMIWNCGNLEQLNKQIEYFMLWLKAKI